MYISNYIGNLNDTNPSFTLSELRTFRSVFPKSYFFAVNSPDSDKTQNIIFVGLASDNSVIFEDVDLERFEDEVYEDLKKHRIDISRYDLDEHILFTDNYAPVDAFIALMLSQNKELN